MCLTNNKNYVIIIIENEREVLIMFSPMCAIIGLGFVSFSCLFFMLMLFYAIFAECLGLPMPLDDRYLFGRVNEKIFLGSMIIGTILFII